jgi:hypothetical protein
VALIGFAFLTGIATAGFGVEAFTTTFFATTGFDATALLIGAFVGVILSAGAFSAAA